MRPKTLALALLAALLIAAVSVAGTVAVMRHSTTPRLVVPAAAVSTSAAPSPSPTRPGRKGFCWDDNNAVPDTAYIVDGVVQCLSGRFIAIDPQPYQQ